MTKNNDIDVNPDARVRVTKADENEISQDYVKCHLIPPFSDFSNREELFSASNIQEVAELYCNYLDHISKDDLTEEERKQRESTKSEIKKFAKVFSKND